METALAGDKRPATRSLLTKPGQTPLTGYVLGERLPAVVAIRAAYGKRPPRNPPKLTRDAPAWQSQSPPRPKPAPQTLPIR